MTTRKEEIEALAMQFRIHGPTLTDSDAFSLAEAHLGTRDRYRAARQPAPEAEQPTPTPRIEVLKRWLECCFELGLHGYVASHDGKSAYLAGADRPASPCVRAAEFRQLYAHAATLKAQQRGEGERA